MFTYFCLLLFEIMTVLYDKFFLFQLFNQIVITQFLQYKKLLSEDSSVFYTNWHSTHMFELLKTISNIDETPFWWLMILILDGNSEHVAL